MKTCRQCGEPFKSGSTVTCLKSECQEAEFKANQARNKPKRRLKPKAGAKMANGDTWREVPGGLEMLEINPVWLNNEVQFARLLCELVANVDDLKMPEVAASMDISISELNSLFDRAEEAWAKAKRAVKG